MHGLDWENVVVGKHCSTMLGKLLSQGSGWYTRVLSCKEHPVLYCQHFSLLEACCLLHSGKQLILLLAGLTNKFIAYGAI
jgi:hypothetical protein